MIKSIFFCGALILIVLVHACQGKQEESTVKKVEQVKSKVEFSQEPLKEYKYKDYKVLGYFNIDKDSVIFALDSIDDSVVKIIENAKIKQVTIDQDYITLQDVNSRKTWKAQKNQGSLFILDQAENKLVCDIKNNGKSIVVYHSFFQISATHQVSGTRAVYNASTYGILKEQQILEDYDFLTAKKGYLIQVSYHLDLQ
ncbi:hypothetical protein ACYSNV_05370 [Myroides sp. LJL119]